jgi:prepilin-type N-terminal cleavage/methylation domain-containing protein
MKKFNKGFTLIELLVVIAIIGILSSVVLASLNTARGKGADAAAKEDLNNMRAQAELTYDTKGDYSTTCANAQIINMMNGAAAAEGVSNGVPTVGTWAGSNSAAVGCTNATTGWVGYVQLNKGPSSSAFWCVDNTGVSKQVSASPGTAATVCPGS